MVNAPDSIVPGKAKPGIAQEFAACLYYHEHGTEKQFEALNAEEVKPWIEKGIKIIQHIDKMEMVLVLKVIQQQKKEDEARHLETLTQIISSFIKTLNTTKKDLFPSAELAHRILRGTV